MRESNFDLSKIKITMIERRKKMIKIENVEVMGWEHAIRGMRNPKNSWDKSDSEFNTSMFELAIGENDYKLMTALRDAGTDHRKFMRMITVYLDITAPLYWWKEFDTYKVGTVANSCSTMHKIHDKEFTLDDFSCEKLLSIDDSGAGFDYECIVRDPENKNELIKGECVAAPLESLKMTIGVLNTFRFRFNKTKNKIYWEQMIQLLPSSYNQKRTVMLNYEVLANLYKSRKAHKLDEWRNFCEWIKQLPYSELIIGREETNE